MSTPTPDQVRVATAALRDEAERWAHQGEALGDAATQAGLLTMTGLEAGLFQGFCTAYQEARTQVTARCAEGRDAMDAVATTLRAVADTYEREEGRNEHRFRNLY